MVLGAVFHSSENSTSGDDAHRQSDGWISDNVLHPFVNGSGVLQFYSTFAEKPIEQYEIPEAKDAVDWCAQNLSSAAGAIVPYVVAAKISGGAMGKLSAGIEAGGLARGFLESEGVAQVIGAGAYDFMKRPTQCETRIGNACGSMLGFAIFGGGRMLVEGSGSTVAKAAGTSLFDLAGKLDAQAVRRVGQVVVGNAAVGALGGVASYETSNRVSSLLGTKTETNWDNRFSAMASGAFLNVALPAVTHGTSKLFDLVANSRSRTTVAPDLSQGPAPPPGVSAKLEAKQSDAITRAPVEPPPESGGLARLDLRQRKTNVPTIAELDRIETNERVPVALDTLKPGSPGPLGATVSDSGINFAVHSSDAKSVQLLVFPDEKAISPSAIFPLNRTGDVWHGFVEDAREGTCYLYRADGTYTPATDGTRFNLKKVLLDPYAKAITGDTVDVRGSSLGYDNTNPGDPNRDKIPSTIDNVHDMPKAIALRAGKFDWKDDRAPNIAMKDSIIYEMNLRAFTALDPTLPENLRGTYEGLRQRIPYVKDLGVTAVELMPIFKFDRFDLPKNNPLTGEPLANSWGYSTTGYQAPEGRFAADSNFGHQVREFQTLVRDLHANGIEVILDVVFNHTREGDQHGPTISFKGLDNNTYYLRVPGHPDQYVDHTGCGNTMNVNHPVVQKFILDSLHYWKEEMHVDGFRFDLATIFNYDVDGSQKAKTPIIAAIENDPVLSKVKLIAEPWGTEQYYLGHFSDKVWAEWNGNYRDVARKFMKGDTGQVGIMADRIVGSPSWFDESKGRNSVNFIDCHDGFPLEDLVEYNGKHNEGNGESNRDGSNDNFSWNCGWEGPLDQAPLSDQQKASIEALRARQVKNLLSMLFLSRGTPMILYGDEVRRTQFGNNNTYCQDGINMLDPQLQERHADHLRYTKMLMQLRKDFDIGGSKPEDFQWRGPEPDRPDWSEGSRFIAWELKPHTDGGKALYSAFNAHWEPLTVTLPPGQWLRLADTNLPAGQDIVRPEQGTKLAGSSTYVLQPRTSLILQGQ